MLVMSDAIASDVSRNAANASSCASANRIPPGIAEISPARVIGSRASRAAMNITTTAIQLANVAIVSAGAEIARTNSGAVPNATTPATSAEYPRVVSDFVGRCTPVSAGRIHESGVAS